MAKVLLAFFQLCDTKAQWKRDRSLVRLRAVKPAWNESRGYCPIGLTIYVRVRLINSIDLNDLEKYSHSSLIQSHASITDKLVYVFYLR